MALEKISICVIGSGNCGTAIAKVIAGNAAQLQDVDDRVNIFVYDEIFEGRRLSDVINTVHVNVKYLPDLQLPANLVACTNLVETAKYADIIVFVVPIQFIEDFSKSLLGKIKPSATAVSLIKGFHTVEGGGIQLISRSIMKFLKIPCSVLVGVNLASEITFDRYCEATLGCRDLKISKLLKDLFSTTMFRVTVIDDADCVEVCGFLKHFIAFGSGLLDGLKANENTRSGYLRFCINEMLRFLDVFYPGCKLSTIMESCGLADLITVCYGSKNRRVGEEIATSNRKIEELENEMYGGERLWGPVTAREVNFMLCQKGLQQKFPMFTMINKICQGEEKPQALMNEILEVPNIIYHPTHLFPL